MTDPGVRGVLEREDGGIISSWLYQLLLVMAVVGLVGFELVAVGVATVNVGEDARQVALVAARTYGSTDNVEQTVAAAREEAASRDVELLDATVGATNVTVEVSKPASTLLLHRIGALEGFTSPTSTGTARWAP